MAPRRCPIKIYTRSHQRMSPPRPALQPRALKGRILCYRAPGALIEPAQSFTMLVHDTFRPLCSAGLLRALLCCMNCCILPELHALLCHGWTLLSYAHCGCTLLLNLYKSLAALTKAKGACLTDAVQRRNSGTQTWTLRSTCRAVTKEQKQKNRMEAEGMKDSLWTRRKRQEFPPERVSWHPTPLVLPVSNRSQNLSPGLIKPNCLHCRAHQAHGFDIGSCHSRLNVCAGETCNLQVSLHGGSHIEPKQSSCVEDSKQRQHGSISTSMQAWSRYGCVF